MNECHWEIGGDMGSGIIFKVFPTVSQNDQAFGRD